MVIISGVPIFRLFTVDRNLIACLQIEVFSAGDITLNNEGWLLQLKVDKLSWTTMTAYCSCK